MAKKQLNSQILSPENYIRQRARNLPLYECCLNNDWEESGLAHITIARRHSNGNITACLYVADLKCLGIKDTFFRFNISFYDYQEMIDGLKADIDTLTADYPLVHNIIHAAWEYAEEMGFTPHKDFLSITQYMLEEDSDNIPLMEITCGGEDGKPFYIQGPLDDDAKANRIINQLTKKVGEGNFHYILSVNNPWDDEDEEDDDDEYEENEFYKEYSHNSFDENAALFLKLFDKIDEKDAIETRDETEFMSKVAALANILCEEIVPEEAMDKWFDRWEEEEDNLGFSDNTYNKEMLGLRPGQLFSDTDLHLLEETESGEEIREYILKKWGEIPYLLHVELGKKTLFSSAKKRVAKYLKQYPDYSLFKMDDAHLKIDEDKADETCIDYKEIFKNRTEITLIEFIKFQMLKLAYFSSKKDLAGIESLYLYTSSVDDWDEEDKDMLLAIAIVARLSALESYLLENGYRKNIST